MKMDYGDGLWRWIYEDGLWIWIEQIEESREREREKLIDPLFFFGGGGKLNQCETWTLKLGMEYGSVMFSVHST